jgi:hypothetical protein
MVGLLGMGGAWEGPAAYPFCYARSLRKLIRLHADTAVLATRTCHPLVGHSTLRPLSPTGMTKLRSSQLHMLPDGSAALFQLRRSFTAFQLRR